MSHNELARRRMVGQRLWGPPLETPEDVVAWLAAVQAQEFPVARWSLGQRAVGVTAVDVDRAFADGAILRTHVLRPTWHFVRSADIRWMLGLSGPRVNALSAAYNRKMDLDDRLLARTNGLIAAALEGGRHLTRPELAAVLERAGIAASGPRLAYVMMRAELDGVICSGAPRAKQQTYALLDERVPPDASAARPADRDEALAELTLRYFTARGPATLKDYLWWSSLTAADGRAGLAMVGSQLEHEVVEGRTYWFAPSAGPARRRSPTVDLVQGYDEVIISYSESRDVLRPPPGPAVAGGRAPFPHAVLLDGQLLGHWRHLPRRDSAAIETSLHRPLGRAEARALDVAVERYGGFLGVPASLARVGHDYVCSPASRRRSS